MNGEGQGNTGGGAAGGRAGGGSPFGDQWSSAQAFRERVTMYTVGRPSLAQRVLFTLIALALFGLSLVVVIPLVLLGLFVLGVVFVYSLLRGAWLRVFGGRGAGGGAGGRGWSGGGRRNVRVIPPRE